MNKFTGILILKLFVNILNYNLRFKIGVKQLIEYYSLEIKKSNHIRP